MEKILRRNLPVWDECADTSFVCGLRDGTLPFGRFKGYIIQDSIYLKNYARIYGKAIYHAATLKELQLYYSMMDFVTDTESAVHLGYLKQFGMTHDTIEGIVPLPETKNYLDFLFGVAERGDGCEILIAVLPCMLSYSYIFRKLALMPESRKSIYWDFIEDYAEERYAERCREWYLFADNKCRNLSEAEQGNLSRIFEKASRFELDFWRMAGRL